MLDYIPLAMAPQLLEVLSPGKTPDSPFPIESYARGRNAVDPLLHAVERRPARDARYAMPIPRVYPNRYTAPNQGNAAIEIKIHRFACNPDFDAINVRMPMRIDLPFPFANDKELDLERGIPMDHRGLDGAIAIQVGRKKIPYRLIHKPTVKLFQRFQSKSNLVTVRYTLKPTR
jgi:hypothetical protein